MCVSFPQSVGIWPFWSMLAVLILLFTRLLVVNVRLPWLCQECPVALAGMPLKAGVGHCWPRPSLVSVHEGSPLGELHRCIREGVKVNVHIRTFKGLRGVCTGFLVAFDKFWNMVSAFLKAPMCLKDMGSLVKQSLRKTSELKSFYTLTVTTELLLLSRKAGVFRLHSSAFPSLLGLWGSVWRVDFFLIGTSVWDVGMLLLNSDSTQTASLHHQPSCPTCL